MTAPRECRPPPGTPDEWPPRCPFCGVVYSQQSCAGDEGYGCPSFEDWKERHPEMQTDIAEPPHE